MKFKQILLASCIIATATAQSASKAILVNLDSAAWEREKGDPPGYEGTMIRSDAATGGMDLLVRFPAGHVIAPHFHDSNERIFVAEGQLTLHREAGDHIIKGGGYAFLPAGEVQRLSCTSKTRCTFYISWDGKQQSHPAK